MKCANCKIYPTTGCSLSKRCPIDGNWKVPRSQHLGECGRTEQAIEDFITEQKDSALLALAE